MFTDLVAFTERVSFGGNSGTYQCLNRLCILVSVGWSDLPQTWENAMTIEQLDIKFRVQLERWDSDIKCKWIQFHRWLPNGRDDAIEYESADKKVKIALWFERHGYIRDKFIEFELDRHEVPDAVMDRQMRLESGPLYGYVTVSDVPLGVAEAVRDEHKGDAEYVAFAKSLVKSHVQPLLSRFSNVVKHYFGQYWIRDFSQWDSRCESIGNYCDDLGMRASIDGGTTWHPFIADAHPRTFTANVLLPNPINRSLIDRDDWEFLKRSLNDVPESTLALQVLRYGHELLDQGNLRHSLVEVVTALEIGTGQRGQASLNCGPLTTPAP